jgi:hypothetical protein
MDPQAAWDQLLAAYAAGDWDILEERATDLTAWLDRGGFPPTILRQPDIDPDWNRALARAGCAHALSVLNDEWRVEQAAFPP